MRTEPMSVIPTTRPRHLYHALTRLVAVAVVIDMSYTRAADNAAPTCTAETQHIRGEFENQDLPIFSD